MYEMMDWWTGREGLSSLADFFEPILAAPTKVSDAKPHPSPPPPFANREKLARGGEFKAEQHVGKNVDKLVTMGVHRWKKIRNFHWHFGESLLEDIPLQ